MKVVLPNDERKPPKEILLSLVPDANEDPLDKNNSITYELRTSPADANSPKYKMQLVSWREPKVSEQLSTGLQRSWKSSLD